MATELDRFHEALRRTEQFEGGWSNDPLDRGGETKYGITQKTWDSWLRNPASYKYGTLPERVADISRNMSVPLYKALYWDTLRCDELHSDDLARRMFDYGVNSGTGAAIKRLQMAYNLIKREELPALKEDGILGNITINAVNAASLKYESALIAAYNYVRMRHYESIIQNSLSQRKFIRGWFARCR